MKTILHFIGMSILCSLSAYGQWNSDPAMPLVVCAETGGQNSVQSFPDGTGGIFTFWLDSRTGSIGWDVYGQHYNAEGIAQWEAGGKEIINYEGRVNIFRIISLPNAEFIITWNVQQSPVLANNGIYVQKMNSNGESIWPEDVKVRNDSSYPNGINNVAMVVSAGDYYIASQGVVIGGSDVLKICKIDGDGNLLWPFGGTTPPSMIGLGSFGISPDMNGGVYVYHSTGNVSGASLKCMLVAGVSDLSNQWIAWAFVTAGTQGVGNQYSGIADNTGITFVWQGAGPEGTGGNIYARRLLASNGALGWNETTKLICAANGLQSRFFWKKSGNNYFITWADSRPGVVGNSAIYAQKFTANGVILWQEYGVQVANLNTYSPNPEFDLDENNTMCITHKASTGFIAQKVTTDGVLVWDPAGIIALTNTFAPSYADFNMVYTGGKFLVVSARSVASGGADNIYISKVTLPAVQVSETVTACNEYTAYGQTFDQSDTYIIDLQDTVATLVLTIVQNIAEISLEGNMLVSVYDGEFRWMDCNTGEFIEGATGPVYAVIASGSYALEVTNGECVSLSECVEVTIVGTNDKGNSNFSLYPNPGVDGFNIKFSGIENPKLLRVFDPAGRLLYTEQLSTVDMSRQIELSELNKGTYFIRIEFEKGRFATTKWMKL